MYNNPIHSTCINNPIKNVAFVISLVSIFIGKKVQYIKGKTPNRFTIETGNKSMGKTLPDKKSNKTSFKKKKEVTSVSQNTSRLIIIFMKKFNNKENRSINGKNSDCFKDILIVIFEACIINKGTKVIITINS